jgi:hypothetical protein
VPVRRAMGTFEAMVLIVAITLGLSVVAARSA